MLGRAAAYNHSRTLTDGGWNDGGRLDAQRATWGRGGPAHGGVSPCFPGGGNGKDMSQTLHAGRPRRRKWGNGEKRRLAVEAFTFLYINVVWFITI